MQNIKKNKKYRRILFYPYTFVHNMKEIDVDFKHNANVKRLIQLLLF